MIERKRVFLFIGPPGSGKGSLSHYCTKEFGWHQLSTGSLCRKNISEGTEIGKQIDFAIKSGKLISDGLIISMVEDWLVNNSATFAAAILDGFPRTIAQAEALSELLTQKNSKCDLTIIRLSISDKMIIERLSGRLICSNNDCQLIYSSLSSSALEPLREMTCDRCTSSLIKRADDALVSVRERLKIYHQHEEELLKFYRKSGLAITEVNVEKPLKDVFKEFQQIMNIKVV